MKKYGGEIEDYLDIHEWLDQTKAAHPDMRHRMILHNSMGPFIATSVFGETRMNSEAKLVDVRQVCEDHIIEDLGRIPALSDFLNLIPESDFPIDAPEIELIDPGSPLEEEDLGQSCWGCRHFNVCVIRRKFQTLEDKFEELDATLDILRCIGSNCSEYEEKRKGNN